MESTPPRIGILLRLGRIVRVILWTLVFAVVVAVAVAGLLFAGRVILYHQEDDEKHLAEKRTYLEQIWDTTSELPAGPNIVVILFDDLGLGDIGAYGGEAIPTPHLDRMAAEGLLFRNGYSPSPYCSASRAGLMTGRYAARSGLDHVLQVPRSWQDNMVRFGGLNRRLPAEEITIAEVLKAAGYATAIVGKWHLGDQSPSLPNDMGFDSFYGLLFSNDQGKPKVWNDKEIVERHPIDQTTLTRRYTEQAVAFIEKNEDRPFFLYLPHTFPHIPLHVGEDRLGTSAAGRYGDVVEELDWSTGEVLAALRRAGVANNTLVVVSSDNGPWFQGSPGGLRGRKFDIFEGGMRVPFMVRWPRRIDAGRVDEELVSGIDLFPTVLELLNVPPPPDRVIDGESLVQRFGKGKAEPRGPVWFHQVGHLRAVRLGRFKYHNRHRLPFGNPPDFALGVWAQKGPWLFDIELDPDESYDVSERHPDTFARMGLMLQARLKELEDNPRGWQ
jgi:arylsulfatase A-like enzyme